MQEEPPDDDLVACILLLYNPATRCPVHVHAYRCDSVETATLLRRQLEALAERPEQQRRLAELESRLMSSSNGNDGGGNNNNVISRKLSSDGRSTRGDSESSGSDRGGDLSTAVVDERTANLYASLAAELREKLGSRARVPILLPPRDYDTVHRSQGKLVGIEARRSKQVNVVGPNGIFSRSALMRTADAPMTTPSGVREDSSGKSSGIGSDEAPSSPPRAAGRRQRDPDAASSSDEEWEAQRQLHAKAAHEYLQWESRSPPPHHHHHHHPAQAEPPSLPPRDIPLMRPHDHLLESRTSSLPRDHGGYPRVLPRVLPRVHSVHSPPQVMMMTSAQSILRPNAYQVLPEEKRYPGLDRETARVHYLGPGEHHQQPPSLPLHASLRPTSPPPPDPRRRSTYLEATPLRPDERRFSYADPSGYRFVYPGRRRVGMAAQQY